MKKTLYTLLVIMLMFLGNIEVLADSNTSNEGTFECKYSYVTNTGHTRNFAIFYDSDSYSTNLNGVNDTDASFFDKWTAAVEPLPFGCLRTVYIKETIENGNHIGSPNYGAGSEYIPEYHHKLFVTPPTGAADIGAARAATCTNCPDSGFDDIFNSSEFDCESLIGEEMISFINDGMNIIKLIVPLLLIVFGVFDFVKAIFASNEDEIKKAQKSFIRRLIIAVIIFFSPILVNFIINMTNEAAGFFNSGTCGVK